MVQKVVTTTNRVITTLHHCCPILIFNGMSKNSQIIEVDRDIFHMLLHAMTLVALKGRKRKAGPAELPQGIKIQKRVWVVEKKM